jgi:KUP system potassium uptake protein
VIALTAGFLSMDLAFWGASLLKIPSGGWFPLVVAGFVFTIMTTWNRGRAILAERLNERTVPFEQFLAEIEAHPPTRVRGTAVYMVRDPKGVPHALIQNLKHNRILHERIILFAVITETISHVPDAERVTLEPLAPTIFRVVAHHGFAEDPGVPELLERLRADRFDVDPNETTFFLGRETLLATNRPGMALWRERLFTVLSRNALRATVFFRLPPDRVVELGAQIEL